MISGRAINPVAPGGHFPGSKAMSAGEIQILYDWQDRKVSFIFVQNLFWNTLRIYCASLNGLILSAGNNDANRLHQMK